MKKFEDKPTREGVIALKKTEIRLSFKDGPTTKNFFDFINGTEMVDEPKALEHFATNENMLEEAVRNLKIRERETKNPELLDGQYKAIIVNCISVIDAINEALKKYPAYQKKFEDEIRKNLLKRFDEDPESVLGTSTKLEYLLLSDIGKEEFENHLFYMTDFIQNDIQLPLFALADEKTYSQIKSEIGGAAHLLTNIAQQLKQYKKPKIDKYKLDLIERRLIYAKKLLSNLIKTTVSQKPDEN